MIPLQNAITSLIWYVTISKCNNFAYFQRIILIYILYCSWIIEIYVLRKYSKMYYVNAYYDVINDEELSTMSSKWRYLLWYI